jgi:hypothetical protein
VYGFGRKPRYYKWTTPIEHQLFAANKEFGDSMEDDSGRSLISIEKSKSLNPAGKPITVEAWIKAEKLNGVILARGGNALGYVLYLQGGKPHFAIRADNKLTTVEAAEKITQKWMHLAGVLTADKKLHIYVDGDFAGMTKAPSLIANDPSEAMQIGLDDGSTVGDYGGSFGFKGLIDEVRIYHRALGAGEIKKHAKASRSGDRAGMVLYYSFDKGNAVDESGNKNHGNVEGTVSVQGRFGQAMKFTGSAGSVPGFVVKHNWTQDVPMIARAMVLAGGTLFIAGPPDLIDEPQAFRQIDEPKIKRNLANQSAALEGDKGALLLAVSAAEGKTLAQYDLDSPPVFDGLVAANGRLYMTTVNGQVVCFQPDQ